jgi:hypothetical protein
VDPLQPPPKSKKTSPFKLIAAAHTRIRCIADRPIAIQNRRAIVYLRIDNNHRPHAARRLRGEIIAARAASATSLLSTLIIVDFPTPAAARSFCALSCTTFINRRFSSNPNPQKAFDNNADLLRGTIPDARIHSP